jgi:hypothetical protein
MALHMIKLCVGCESVDQLLAWHRDERGGAQPWVMHTRQTPKRAAELIESGYLYRVFKGSILCRQKILAIDTIGEGPASRCEVRLDPEVILTAPSPRRPFQGWRYLETQDCPPDLGQHSGDVVPQDLAQQLRMIGAW